MLALSWHGHLSEMRDVSMRTLKDMHGTLCIFKFLRKEKPAIRSFKIKTTYSSSSYLPFSLQALSAKLS